MEQQLIKKQFTLPGARLSGGHSLHETSSVLVETVTKSSSVAGSFSTLPKFSSDASKVVSRGAGLSKAFIGQKNTFTVDCSKAGTELCQAFMHVFVHNAHLQMTFNFCRDKHVNGRSARAKDSLWGSLRQTHGQQNVQCHIHSEGERRLHPHSQMGWRNGARKPFPRHSALKDTSPLCKDSTDPPGKETGLTDNAFSWHINSLCFTNNQENVLYLHTLYPKFIMCSFHARSCILTFFFMMLF